MDPIVLTLRSDKSPAFPDPAGAITRAENDNNLTALKTASDQLNSEKLVASTAALSVKANATNATASATDVAAGTDGHVLRRSGTTLGFGTLAAGAYASNTIPITAIANQAATTILGNAAAGSAAVTAISAGTDGHVMRRSGTTLSFGTVATAGITDAAITLAKMANLAQDQFIGRTTASTGVPQTATITAAARTVLDDTTVAAMVDTLGGAASTGTGGLARADSPAFTGTPTAPTAAVSTNTTQVATTAFVRGEISNISGTITTAKTSFSNADKALALDAASSDAPVTITGAVIRTVPVGTSLGTTGSVALDFSTLVGTRQSITASGNITFTTSNLAAGRGFELRIGAGGSTRTLTWPAWVAFGAALPTSLASGATLIVSLFANSTTDASVDAVAVVSA